MFNRDQFFLNIMHSKIYKRWIHLFRCTFFSSFMSFDHIQKAVMSLYMIISVEIESIFWVSSRFYLFFLTNLRHEPKPKHQCNWALVVFLFPVNFFYIWIHMSERMKRNCCKRKTSRKMKERLSEKTPDTKPSDMNRFLEWTWWWYITK